MIEFKGECGHTIRARDEDAGKVVRCSYCGKEAIVARPGGEGEDGDLLSALEQTGTFDAYATKASRKSHREQARAKKRTAQGKPATVDPFAVILKMTYAAIIIVIAAVAWKYIPNLYSRLAGPVAGPSPSPEAVVAVTPPPVVSGETPSVAGRRGLQLARLDIHPDGAYVSSVPGDARVYHLPKWGVVDTILDNDEARMGMHTDTTLKLTPGRHTIAIALRINQGELMDLPGYPELRRALEAPDGDFGAGKRLEDFFVPDGSVGTRLGRLDQFRYVARIYEIEVQGNWVAVTALFLPRAPLAELMAHLPHRQAYTYDVGEVERELKFYEVPDADRRRLMDALTWVGKMCYRAAPGQPYRIFQIDPVSGLLIPEEIGF